MSWLWIPIIGCFGFFLGVLLMALLRVASQELPAPPRPSPAPYRYRLMVHVPIARLMACGYYFRGELAEKWAGGRLDERSIQCRN